MKKLLFLLLIITYTSAESQDTKTIKVTYIKAYKNYKDSSDTSPKVLKNLEYQLSCNLIEARFEYIQNMSNDGNISNMRLVSKGGGNGIYYKNNKTKKKLHQVTSLFDEKKYLVESPFNEYLWNITNEIKIISGYKCYKAIAEYEVEFPDELGKMKINKNKVVVWFTPDINFSFGPAGFDGLPGLVLEKYSNSFYFIATKISYNKPINKIQKPDGIEITKENYETKTLEYLRKLK